MSFAATAPPTQRDLSQTVGALLRAWREKRRLSQLELALDAEVSARHLSFVETGRSRPSPDLLLALAEQMDIPLRERNQLLLAAGYAPRFAETPLASPDLEPVKGALERLLQAHDPYPGIAMDRLWNVVLANDAATQMVASLPAALKESSINMFRASLHPEGFAAMTANFSDWGAYVLHELERIAASTLDPAATALLEEVGGYDTVKQLRRSAERLPRPHGQLLLPCILNLPQGGRLSLFTTLATLGSPLDVTLAELTVELFYPADAASEALLRRRQPTGAG